MTNKKQFTIYNSQGERGRSPGPCEAPVPKPPKADRFALVRGFTALEALATLAVLGFLIVSLLVYAGRGGKQVALFREQTKFVSEIYRTRASAVNLIKSKGEVICGYGINILSATQYVIYKELPTTATCPGDYKWTNEDETVELFKLDPAIVFSDAREISDVLFIPPDPVLYFDGNKADSDKYFEIQIKDGHEIRITINPLGQILVK